MSLYVHPFFLYTKTIKNHENNDHQCWQYLRRQITSWDIDERIVEVDWTRGPPAHTIAVVLYATFPWWSSPCKKQRYKLVLKESCTLIGKRHNWPHPAKSGCLGIFFPWWLPPCKKLDTNSFQINLQSKNPATWLDGSHAQPKL